MKKFFFAALLVLLILSSPLAAAEEPLRVVASFSILGDMVKEVGGDAVALTVLAGPGADMHSFRPKPEDAKALAEADIIAINGLGLEGWLHRLIEASGTKAKLLVASAGVKARLMEESGKPVADPHAWQNLAFGRLYVRNIAGALIRARPEQAAAIRKRAALYDKQLKEMDAAVRAAFAGIPAAKRKIITSHDAFGYFGDAYNVTFLSPLGLSTEAEPSARDVARLIDQIKAEGVREVFIETMTNPRLMEQISRESGARIGGELYSDSLSKPGGPAPTYLDMFRHNVPLMRAAMEENRR